MNSFNECLFVFELITLGMYIEVMIDILVNFLGLSVFLEKSSEDSLSPHPQDLGWHTGVSGTLSLTSTVMSSYNSKHHMLVNIFSLL